MLHISPDAPHRCVRGRTERPAPAFLAAFVKFLKFISVFIFLTLIARVVIGSCKVSINELLPTSTSRELLPTSHELLARLLRIVIAFPASPVFPAFLTFLAAFLAAFPAFRPAFPASPVLFPAFLTFLAAFLAAFLAFLALGVVGTPCSIMTAMISPRISSLRVER